MQDKPTGGDLAADDHDMQCLILNLVVHEDQRPWSVAEVVRALCNGHNHVAIEDALGQLRDIGLINQAEQMVFASRAAAHIDRLGMLAL
jgi:hypothetical protein